MAGTLLRPALVLFGLSFLIYLNAAVPITRTKNLTHGPRVQVYDQVSKNTHHLVSAEQGLEHGSGSISRRMSVELNDYPGSGANNRHTPRPQFGRCVDC